MKATLTKQWLTGGQRFGPGEVETDDLPATIVEKLRRKGALPAAEGKSAKKPVADDLWQRMALTGDQGAALQSAGYGDRTALSAASDDDLLALPHIGEAAVRKIRAALAGSKE